MKENIEIYTFSAKRCSPCKAMKPEIDKVKEKYKESVIFYDIDIDDCPTLTELNNIRKVPTFILFLNGKEISRISWTQNYDWLNEFINNHK